MFDIFTKTEKTQKQKTSAKKNTRKPAQKASLNFNQSAGNNPGSSIKIFIPESFDDIADIIDFIIMGKPAIVHMKDLKDSTAQRVLDILCGAIYALKGGLCELEPNIYVITPDGVDTNK